MIYKVECEFFVKADSEEAVMEYLEGEAGYDFTENHLVVSKDKSGEEDVYIDLSEEEVNEDEE